MLKSVSTSLVLSLGYSFSNCCYISFNHSRSMSWPSRCLFKDFLKRSMFHDLICLLFRALPLLEIAVFNLNASSALEKPSRVLLIGWTFELTIGSSRTDLVFEIVFEAVHLRPRRFLFFSPLLPDSHCLFPFPFPLRPFSPFPFFLSYGFLAPPPCLLLSAFGLNLHSLKLWEHTASHLLSRSPRFLKNL